MRRCTGFEGASDGAGGGRGVSTTHAHTQLGAYDIILTTFEVLQKDIHADNAAKRLASEGWGHADAHMGRRAVRGRQRYRYIALYTT